MDALSQFIVVFSFFDLSGIYFPKIKQHTVLPAVKIGHLHLHVHFRTVLEFYQHIKDSQLVFFAFLPKSCREQGCPADHFRSFPQYCRNKSFSHFRILHQFFKTEIHSGKHDKVVAVSFTFLCTHMFFLLILTRYLLRRNTAFSDSSCLNTGRYFSHPSHFYDHAEFWTILSIES